MVIALNFQGEIQMEIGFLNADVIFVFFKMETAENQLKSCEKVIHRLYGENTDLTKQNQNLEGKLKSASQSQEKLQRKKVLLEKLVEKLTNHMGKKAAQQSHSVFELNKDVSA